MNRMDRFTFEKNGLHYWVFENTEFGKSVVCVCVYKKGAVEVTRRLNEMWEENTKEGAAQ